MKLLRPQLWLNFLSLLPGTIYRARIEARCRAAEIRFQLDPSLANRRALEAILAVLEEYGDTF
ncbi:hypothetical protein [Sodalinema gerasimenkoae]|uniref:hypothetical protein n=1 Tax=Sodalinema gerasimenkoae TaxID=2862348 RepID=UPI001359B0E3|nr:hypothetical protein [Sodalinema gerasimenkoae]